MSDDKINDNKLSLIITLVQDAIRLFDDKDAQRLLRIRTDTQQLRAMLDAKRDEVRKVTTERETEIRQLEDQAVKAESQNEQSQKARLSQLDKEQADTKEGIRRLQEQITYRPHASHRPQFLRPQRISLHSSFSFCTRSRECLSSIRDEIAQLSTQEQQLRERITNGHTRLRHERQLYETISGIKWDYETPKGRVQGFISRVAPELVPFNLESTGTPAGAVAVANQLWGLLERQPPGGDTLPGTAPAT
ncbi:hypothetical protein PAPYR_6087 [Paratrimastix pyriformis]|uniref:Kinetochore protein Spc24 n=1 Tax=Paratrimastix pyriformis TaxID=342808 RepID=A0ABQ8UKN2_9EUKA|nr:hypothetical protein PAPYR_6087 [Paratrimastix pyriformis]